MHANTPRFRCVPQMRAVTWVATPPHPGSKGTHFGEPSETGFPGAHADPISILPYSPPAPTIFLGCGRYSGQGSNLSVFDHRPRTVIRFGTGSGHEFTEEFALRNKCRGEWRSAETDAYTSRPLATPKTESRRRIPRAGLCHLTRNFVSTSVGTAGWLSSAKTIPGCETGREEVRCDFNSACRFLGGLPIAIGNTGDVETAAPG